MKYKASGFDRLVCLYLVVTMILAVAGWAFPDNPTAAFTNDLFNWQGTPQGYIATFGVLGFYCFERLLWQMQHHK